MLRTGRADKCRASPPALAWLSSFCWNTVMPDRQSLICIRGRDSDILHLSAIVGPSLVISVNKLHDRSVRRLDERIDWGGRNSVPYRHWSNRKPSTLQCLGVARCAWFVARDSMIKVSIRQNWTGKPTRSRKLEIPWNAYLEGRA